MQQVDPANDGVADTVATHEPMTQRVVVAAPDGASARFLHLVQGADAGAAPTPATLISSGDGFVGLAVNQTAVLFSEEWAQPVSGLRYTAPASTTRHIITGLEAGAGYRVAVTPAPEGVTVTLASGGDQRADSAGVLVVAAAPAASTFLPLLAAAQ